MLHPSMVQGHFQTEIYLVLSTIFLRDKFDPAYLCWADIAEGGYLIYKVLPQGQEHGQRVVTQHVTEVWCRRYMPEH